MQRVRAFYLSNGRRIASRFRMGTFPFLLRENRDRARAALRPIVAAAILILVGAGFGRLSETAEPDNGTDGCRGSTASYDFVRRTITVDGNPSDWRGVAANVVQGEDHLWFGQGMVRAGWHGNADLSYQWRGAWDKDKLYFLFEVNDDRLVPAGQPQSFLCDCVELYLDYNHSGGRRVVALDGREDWFSKCDRREIRGFEIHFLPTTPVRIYLDHAHQYAVDKPQTEEFSREWSGWAAMKKTPGGYLLELGLSVPGVELQAGKLLGLETGVCDDDGTGRESIMMWTGTKQDFWLTMDGYGKVCLLDTPAP